jgi:hypothetical protein
MPFQFLGSPDQVENTERWAEPGSLEDSCPSYARAARPRWRRKKVAELVAWRTRALPMPRPT